MADGPAVGLDATYDEVSEAIGGLDRRGAIGWHEFEFAVEVVDEVRDDVAAGPPSSVGSVPSGGYVVANLLRILEHLALAPRSAPELAELLQVDPRSCRRVLNRLEAEGYVEHDGRHRRRWRLTFRAASVAAQMLHASPLPVLAAQRLESVAALGSTAHLWTASPGGTPLSIVRVTATAEGHETEFSPASAPAEDTPASRVFERRPSRRELPTLRALGDELHRVAEADHARQTRSSCVVNVHDGLATVAAGVVHHGRVAAAVGLTSAAGTRAALAAVRAAQDLADALARVPAAAG